MSPVLLRVLFALSLFMIIPQNSDGAGEELGTQYCIADPQTPDYVLQGTLDWICGPQGGANCSEIQEGQSCYYPNTYVDHASYAFNDYYQKFKYQGATCNFDNSGMIDERDPSHDSCKFVFLP